MMFSSCTTSSSKQQSKRGFTLSSLSVLLLLLLLVLQLQQNCIRAQQSYLANKQLDCDNNADITQGFVCNGVNKSCSSYLTFRPHPPYNTPASIARLLGLSSHSSSLIASLNNISNLHSVLPTSSIIIVPLSCSCSRGRYQHNASYTLGSESETYFSVANLTYGGLTTCQSLISHNPYGIRNLSPGLTLQVPLMCACPTFNQSAAGFNFLLSYLVTWGDNIESIAATFSVPPLSVLEANQLKQDDIIHPFNPILVPLRNHPTAIKSMASPPPAALSPLLPPTVPAPDSGSSSHKWIFVGVGVGAALLVALITFLLFCSRRRRRRSSLLQGDSVPSKSNKLSGSTAINYNSDWHSISAAANQSSSWSISTQGIQYALESSMVYKFEDIQKATDYFSESNRIQASVYRGSFNGDNAAVKMMKGDVSGEINILKKINHSNVIRLSGFCLHEGNTYLVYEYAEKGSLDNWIHSNSKDVNQQTIALSWQQRVQIACDVADSLNYLHNFVNPPYIHKNLKSSNILLDGNLRAKVTNFGLARTVSTDEGLQLTRHVVGTQGYMAPEYIENGVITPKLDVFAFGVVLLELLSGKEATAAAGEKNGQELLHASIDQVLEGDNVREKLKGFVDPSLRHEYPLDLAFSMACLARSCVAHDMNSRPDMSEILMTLSKVVSSSRGWDPSDELDRSTSATD